MTTIALCSLLHESPTVHSGTRRFRGEPVLRWTMRRLALTTRIDKVVLLAWDDQLEALADLDVVARACGPRRDTAGVESVAAAQRWADGWRGGLMQTCWFDNGFTAAFVRDAMTDEQADHVVLVDPAAGLVDPQILDDLVAAAERGTRDFYFTQAAPGLGGVLLRRTLVDTLAAESWLPGKLVHYLPDAPCLDPITSDACVPVPLVVSRTPDRYTLDGRRQIKRLEAATVPLNGTLISSHASAIVERVASAGVRPEAPKDVTLELTVRRASRPVFGVGTHACVDRPDLPVDRFDAVLAGLATMDDARVTLAGVGDPLLHPRFADWIGRLTAVAAVSIETDLIDCDSAAINAVVAAGVDVVAVHLPAATPATYAAVMGTDAMPRVLDNIRRLLEARQRAGSGTPIVVPLFTKLRQNFDEMEVWYDTWLRAVGSAAIVGPTAFGGRVTGIDVADLTPPVRRPCARLHRRATVLSDGRIAACEQDAFGEIIACEGTRHDGDTPVAAQPAASAVASATSQRTHSLTLASAWRGPMNDLRNRHASLTDLPDLCTRCTEWHRP